MSRTCAVVLLLTLSRFAAADMVTEFEAILTPEAVITAGMMPSAGISDAFGSAQFLLTIPDVGSPTLTYSIQVTGIDLDGAQTPGFPDDDLTAMHFHDTTRCASPPPGCIEGVDTVGTKHVLNIKGFPREDDLQMMTDAAAGIVTGEWDDGDEDLTVPPSNALSGETADGDAILDLLFDELLFVNVHTNVFGLGEIGGFIRQAPEPSSSILVWVGLLIMGCRRR